MISTKYQLEDIREFLIRRPFFADSNYSTRGILSRQEFGDLKDRKLSLTAERAAHLRSFIEGWKAAKT